MSATRIRMGQDPNKSYLQIQREYNEVVGDLTRRAPIDASGDLTALGGYHMLVGPFMYKDLAADTTNVLQFTKTVGAVPTDFAAPRSGSVVGFSAILSAVDPAVDMTVKIVSLTSGVTLTSMVFGKTSTTYTKTFVRNLVSFLPNDVLSVRALTTASWGLLNDITAFLEIEM